MTILDNSGTFNNCSQSAWEIYKIQSDGQTVCQQILLINCQSIFWQFENKHAYHSNRINVDAWMMKWYNNSTGCVSDLCNAALDNFDMDIGHVYVAGTN